MVRVIARCNWLFEVKGDHIFKGYWKLPEKLRPNSMMNVHYWRHGHAIEDGYVSIVGRGKDLIISGGLNIYPKEIEDVLNDQKGVVRALW